MQVNIGLLPTDIIVKGNDFYDTAAVTPIGREISYTYRIPYKTDKISITWKQNYKISRFDLLIQDPQINVTGDKLIEEEPLNIGNKNYNHYSSQNLISGGSLTAQISGLTIAAGSVSFNWIWITVIPVLGIILFLMRKRKATTQITNRVTVVSPQEDLLAEIVELDNSYQDGLIDQQKYLSLRAEKKDLLKKLMQTPEKRVERDR